MVTYIRPDRLSVSFWLAVVDSPLFSRIFECLLLLIVYIFACFLSFWAVMFMMMIMMLMIIWTLSMWRIIAIRNRYVVLFCLFVINSAVFDYKRNSGGATPTANIIFGPRERSRISWKQFFPPTPRGSASSSEWGGGVKPSDYRQIEHCHSVVLLILLKFIWRCQYRIASRLEQRIYAGSLFRNIIVPRWARSVVKETGKQIKTHSGIAAEN